MALEAANRPLFCSEMVEWAKGEEMLSTTGKTPTNTLYASIMRSIKGDPFTPFIKLDDGRFRLKLGMSHDLPAQSETP
jgi:hypothetical protein